MRFHPERLKEERIKKGLSQEQLAKKIGVTRQAVSAYETGERIPSSKHLMALAKVLKISANKLYY